jgi:uncharacterized repeat protein (TIGR04042 family)
MPETPFTVLLPDGSVRHCYSPSSIVRQHFTAGETITAADFIRSARAALTEASERVRRKFGFACTAAAASLSQIEEWAGALPPETPLVIQRI